MGETLTVNELLTLMKVIRDRLSSLRKMRDMVSLKENRFWKTSGEIESVQEPQYDVKEVDKKIVELENFLFRADAAVKTANAKTYVDMYVDPDSLLAPLS